MADDSFDSNEIISAEDVVDYIPDESELPPPKKPKAKKPLDDDDDDIDEHYSIPNLSHIKNKMRNT